MKKIFNYFPVVLLVAFALLTLFLSSSVLFDWFGIREKEGNYVLFVVWANFICSILYLIAAYGFIKSTKWTFQVLSISVIILTVGLIGLFVYIDSGGLYETKTIGAMLFRIAVTLVFTGFAYLKFKKQKMYKEIAILLIAFTILSFNESKPEETHSLTVKAEGFRNSKGEIVFALYNKDGSIPDEKYENYFKKGVAQIDENSVATFTFRNLPEGTYAANILHDENKNGKIDKKFMLPLPAEGIGFSNYESIGMSNRPKFSKASFGLNKNLTVNIKVIYL